MTDFTDTIHKHLDDAFKKVEKDWKERVEPFIEKTRKSIKHPHFYYAVVDTEKLTAEYKRKKWYQWFSGKRIVHIKLLRIKGTELTEYRPMNNYYLYDWNTKKESETK